MKNKKVVIVVLAVVLVGAGVTFAFYLFSGGRTSTVHLPAGCTKPSDGFLIVASNRGYNDSVDHGVPEKNWPVLNVTQGQTVNITVCNTDFQAHGFQVTHYFDSTIETVVPGQVLHVSFVATEAGQFRIYCNIFCSIHWAMQSGLLIVTSA